MRTCRVGRAMHGRVAGPPRRGERSRGRTATRANARPAGVLLPARIHIGCWSKRLAEARTHACCASDFRAHRTMAVCLFTLGEKTGMAVRADCSRIWDSRRQFRGRCSPGWVSSGRRHARIALVAHRRNCWCWDSLNSVRAPTSSRSLSAACLWLPVKTADPEAIFETLPLIPLE